MKFFIVIAAALFLNSCNTCIGIYRDTKQGVNWARGKMQGSGGGSGGGGDSYDPSGAPVY